MTETRLRRRRATSEPGRCERAASATRTITLEPEAQAGERPARGASRKPPIARRASGSVRDASVKRGWYRGISTSRPGFSGRVSRIWSHARRVQAGRQQAERAPAGARGHRALARARHDGPLPRAKRGLRATLQLPRRPDHGQQPDGRPPRLGPHVQGRSTSATTRCSAHEQRYQNGFDCQGLWVEVEVEKELGFNSKREIETSFPGGSIDRFVELCKQRVDRFAAPHDRAVDPLAT